MAVRTLLKMGDPLLLEVAKPVTEFNTPELQELVSDLFETMHAHDGVGIAAPQIGVSLQVVIFGFQTNPRYPNAAAVSETVLINPVLTPLTDDLFLAGSFNGWIENDSAYKLTRTGFNIFEIFSRGNITNGSFIFVRLF